MKHGSPVWEPRVVPQGRFLLIASLAGGLWLLALAVLGLLGVGAVRAKQQGIGPLGWVAEFVAVVVMSGVLAAAHALSQYAHGGRDAPAAVRAVRLMTYAGLGLYLLLIAIWVAHTSTSLQFQGVG